MNRTLHEMQHRWLIALLNLVFLTAAATLQGAAINWEPATYIASDSDVRTDGTAVYAYAWSGIASTVNGVSFAGSPGINGGITCWLLRFLIMAPRCLLPKRHLSQPWPLMISISSSAQITYWYCR